MTYNAFISYNHTADQDLASALQVGLHQFAKPWYRFRALNIFLDKSNLSATPALWGSIETALSNSEYLLLLASQNSASSEWVNREVALWLEKRSWNKLLIVLTEGDLSWDPLTNDYHWTETTPLPPCLRGVFSEEPYHLDLRWATISKKGLSLRHTKFREAISVLGATLHNRPKEDLIGEDHRLRRRAITAALSAVTALVILTIIATGAAYWATRERDIAIKQRDEANRQREKTTAREMATESMLRLGNTGGGLIEAALLITDSLRLSYSLNGYLAATRILNILPKPISRIEHSSDVSAVKFVYNSGKIAIATGSKEAVIELSTWDDMGALKITSTKIPSTKTKVMAIDPAGISVFDPKGQQLAIGGSAGVVQIWDSRSGKMIMEFHDLQSRVNALAFDKQGTRLAAAGNSNEAIVWDLINVRQLYRLPHMAATVSAVDFNANGDLIVTATGGRSQGQSGEIWLWEASSGASLQRITKRDNGFVTLALSPDGTHLAASGMDNDISVWDIGKNEQVLTLSHADWIRQVIFSPDGKQIASASTDGTARVWDISAGEEVSRFTHDNIVTSVAFNSDGTRLASGGRDKTVWVWELSSGMEVGRFQYGRPVSSFDINREHIAAAIGPIPGRPNTFFRLGSVYLQKLNASLKPVRINCKTGVYAVSLSPDSSLIAAACRDGLSIYNTISGQLHLKLSTSHTTAVSFSLDGERLLSGGVFGELIMWDIQHSKPLFTLKHERRQVYDIVFSNQGQMFAVAAGDNSVRVCDAGSGRVISRLMHEHAPTSVDFSPDSKIIASGGYDFVVRLWEIDSRKIISEFNHNYVVMGVRFSPDGKLLASVGMEGKLKIWDIASGQNLAVLDHGGVITDVKFGRENSQLITSGDDGKVRMWQLLNRDEIIEAICSRITSELWLENWQKEHKDITCKFNF
jgi:WD40 repeat protein